MTLDLRRWLLTGWLALLAPVAVAAEDYDSIIQQGLTERNAGNFEAAEASFRRALAIADDKREAAMLLGLVHAFQEEFDSAMRVIDSGLEMDADYVPLLLAKARVQSYQSRFEASLETLESVPDENREAQALRARIALYQGRYIVGRDRFSGLVAEDPDDLEALVGLHDAERYLGNNDEAEAILVRAERVAPGHPDVVARRDRDQAVSGPRHQVVASFGGSRFDVPLARWYERSVEYWHFSAGGNHQFIRVDHAHRFGLHDTGVEVGARFRGDSSTPIEVSASVSEDAGFLPEYSLGLQLGFRVHAGTERVGATLGRVSFERLSYLTGPVTRLDLQFDHYLTGTSAWFTGGAGWVRTESGANDVSWRIGVNHQATGRLRWGLNYYDAPETNNNISIETRTLHGYLRLRLADRTWLRLDGARHDRVSAWHRDSLALTLGYRF